MLKAIRIRLRKIKALHSMYMRAKRMFTGELVGMTSKTEQDYLHKYGADEYLGFGEVVDLGCFLGSTTIPLARGLAGNPAFSGRKIHSFDAFIWYESMDEAVSGADIGGLRPGDSFLGEFKRRTIEFEKIIEVHPGDLTMLGWDNRPIEFLLVDSMKNWDLANAIFRNFYAYLVPNQSLVFHQDFAHYFTGWIHLLHWRLREHFEFVAEVPQAASVVLKFTKPIPESLFEESFSFGSFSDEEIDAAFEHSLSLVSSDKHANILAAKVMCFCHQNRTDKARIILSEIEASGVPMTDELEIIRQLIAAD